MQNLKIYKVLKISKRQLGMKHMQVVCSRKCVRRRPRSTWKCAPCWQLSEKRKLKPFQSHLKDQNWGGGVVSCYWRECGMTSLYCGGWCKMSGSLLKTQATSCQVRCAPTFWRSKFTPRYLPKRPCPQKDAFKSICRNFIHKIV